MNKLVFGPVAAAAAMMAESAAAAAACILGRLAIARLIGWILEIDGLMFLPCRDANLGTSKVILIVFKTIIYNVNIIQKLWLPIS